MTTLSAQERTFFNIRADAINDAMVEHKTMAEGCVDFLGFNLTPIKNTFDITVSSSTWEANGNAVSITSSANTAVTTQITATASSAGIALLKNTITMSDGQVIIRYIRVSVKKLDRSKDYPSF